MLRSRPALVRRKFEVPRLLCQVNRDAGALPDAKGISKLRHHIVLIGGQFVVFHRQRLIHRDPFAFSQEGGVFQLGVWVVLVRRHLVIVRRCRPIDRNSIPMLQMEREVKLRR
jgi:hypothetical protein